MTAPWWVDWAPWIGLAVIFALGIIAMTGPSRSSEPAGRFDTPMHSKKSFKRSTFLILGIIAFLYIAVLLGISLSEI